MLTLSSAIIAEKNKISTTGVWHILLEVAFPGEELINLALNTEDVTWESKTWQAFPFDLDPVTEDSQGTLPSYAIKVSNIGRAFVALVDRHSGGEGATTRLLIVHSEHLDELTPVFEDVAEIIGCNVGTEWIIFTLGAENPLQQRSPRQRYLTNHCRYKEFKGTLCGYAGAEGNCNRTMGRCEELNNLTRFGGQPGIGLSEGVYL